VKSEECHCEERSDEAISTLGMGDCPASLAMTCFKLETRIQRTAHASLSNTTIRSMSLSRFALP
jgi:hypothetical protein